MSYQVGDSCFPTLADAGVAACSQFRPLSSLSTDGTVLRTVSCVGADPSTGALSMQISSAPVGGGAATVQTFPQTVAFLDCQQQQYVDASLSVFGSLLALVFVPLSLWLVVRWVNKGSRNYE